MDSRIPYMDLMNDESAAYEAGYGGNYSNLGVGGDGGGNDSNLGVGGDGDEREDNNDEERGSKRLPWTEEDNIRLISAWLNNSVDSIDGNAKKGEVYWKDVAKEYNNNSHADRRRKAVNCKDHWGKMNRKIVLFNGIWCRLKEVYESGQSDDQLMNKAHDMYKSEQKQSFTLGNLWRELQQYPKWTRIYAEEKMSTADDDVVHEIQEETRPPGRNIAKDKRNGKGKSSSEFSSGLSHDDIQLYYDTNVLRASTQEKMHDAQLQVYKDKRAAAEAQERTAIISREQASMEKYMELLMANTAIMSDFQRAEHERALEFLRDKVMGSGYSN